MAIINNCTPYGIQFKSDTEIRGQ